MSPIRVLLIDDSEELRAVLRVSLERAADFEVIGDAATGESGVAAAVDHQPDLVLLDLAMPEMDGLEALPLIRAAAPDATVVMLSGFSEESAALSAIEQGAHGFIRKGLSLRDLRARLREIVEMRLERRDRAHDR